jgi:hypothetical protein
MYAAHRAQGSDGVNLVHDVEERYDAGFGALGVFGVAPAGPGAVGPAWKAARRRRNARFRTALPPEPWR